MKPYLLPLAALLVACSGSTDAPTDVVDSAVLETATPDDSGVDAAKPADATASDTFVGDTFVGDTFVGDSRVGDSGVDSGTSVVDSSALDSATILDASDASDAGPPATMRARARRDAMAKYYGSACQGGTGLIYRGSGASAGTQLGTFFRKYTAPPTCTFVVAGDCVSMKCTSASSTFFDRGGVEFKSEIGDRYVTWSSGSYYTGITSSPIIPAAPKPVQISLRPSGPSPLVWSIPSPGAVSALTVPASTVMNVPRDRDLVVSWTTTETPAVGSVLVSIAAGETRIECPVDASAASITVPTAVMRELPAVNGGITVTAHSEAFVADAECEIYQWLERIPTPSTSGRSVFFVDSTP